MSPPAAAARAARIARLSAHASSATQGARAQSRVADARVALITGAARGLGAAIADVLADAGWRVVLADVRLPLAQERAAQLRDRGAVAHALALDVRDEANVQATLAEAKQQAGRLDAVINSAAIDLTVPIDELPGDTFDSILRTNLTGPFLVARHAVPLFGPATQAGAARGHIVNIASTASKRAWPNASAYHASKWGLLGLSHALHAELRGQGIKVSAIVAGGMRTPFLLDRFPDIDPDVLQDPLHVARTVHFVLEQPAETVIPEVMVLPMRETSWP